MLKTRSHESLLAPPRSGLGSARASASACRSLPDAAPGETLLQINAAQKP